MPNDLNNKAALLNRKQKILDALRYTEMRIEEVRKTSNLSAYFEDDSSDSDVELGLPDIGPSVVELKMQQNKLKTCSQATQELTGVTVLQSEVTVVVEPPKFDDEPPVKEEGTWREVTAECRVNYVPFSINFFVHKPAGQFSSCSYRCMRVLVVKVSQETELARSVLHSLTRPADAVQVIRSYAESYRSRRASLARLAERYGSALHMEPHPEGGFVLKCGNVLEVSWRLENKSSPIALFHHRMKFDLDYIDESYIKTISQAHKQLSDPTLNTDDRTLLLSKIISTCLEAQGPNQDYESLESDQESIKRNKTILDQDNDTITKKQARKPVNVDPPRERDAEVMAPPKTVPKKTKLKDKENTVGNKAVKRTSGDDDAINVKKAKIDNVRTENAETVSNEQKSAKNVDLNDVTAKEGKSLAKKAVEVNASKKSAGTSKRTKDSQELAKNAKTTAKIDNISHGNTKLANIKSISANTKTKAIDNDNNPQINKVNKKVKVSKNEGKENHVNSKPVTSKTDINKQKDLVRKATDAKVTDDKEPSDMQTENAKSNIIGDTNDIVRKTDTNKKLTKPSNSKVINMNVNQNSDKTKKSKEKLKTDINKENLSKAIKVKKTDSVATKKIVENTTIQKVTEKSASVKNKDNLKEFSPNLRKEGKSKTIVNNPLKILNRYSVSNKIDAKASKIPQKAVTAVSEKTLKRNPLRISPRKITSKFRSPSANAKIQRNTNIPRLMKKPVPKS